MTSLSVVSLLLSFALVFAQNGATSGDWWKTAVFYQIYPRSFMDSNNDGVGDLPGILQRLDYLASIGVTALWLSPIYASPMKDFGYDISDFRAIDPTFGTMQDFDELVAAAKAHGLRVVMDFVPNHSSDAHDWFQRSARGEPPFADYYVWRRGRANNTLPPNNWVSMFHGPAWTYHPSRDLWYLHQFHSGQPDLNFRCPHVVQEMNEVLTFWMDRGVDGFRVDTISTLVEHASFADEALTHDPGCTPNDRCYTRSDLQQDQPETFEMVYQWRRLLDSYDPSGARIMMTESYSSMENLLRLYGNESHPGAHFSFNFDFITKLDRSSSARDFQRVINTWLELPSRFTRNWVLGNHDQRRLASRFGVERSDVLLGLQMILPGVAVTYNGEEIAMEDGEVTWEQGTDPQACQGERDDFERNSRDFQRTPMQWDTSINAGFNTGHATWLPVSSKYRTCNVMQQQISWTSHLHLYRRLLKFRSKPLIQNGDCSVEVLNDNVLVVRRSLPGEEACVLYLNLSGKKQVINPNSLIGQREPQFRTAKTATHRLMLQPYEAVLF